MPLLGDIFPWRTTAIAPHRTWVYGATPEILADRWNRLVAETDRTVKRDLFKETSDRNLASVQAPLPGVDTYKGTTKAFADERGKCPAPVRVGYRLFDRQWLIPDSRLIDRPRPDLWEARIPDQFLVVEQHTKVTDSGPGILFTHLVPDMDYFKGSEGGRTLPLLHPDGTPNLAKNFTVALSALLGRTITAEEVVANCAGIAGHPGFTATFTDELTTPGIRIPFTRDPDRFDALVEVGQRVVWAHTYGEAFSNAERTKGNVRFDADDERQPLALTAPSELSDTMIYDEKTRVITIGDGSWGPVEPGVWSYSVGGKNVLRSWFNYRKTVPLGKKSSPWTI